MMLFNIFLAALSALLGLSFVAATAIPDTSATSASDWISALTSSMTTDGNGQGSYRLGADGVLSTLAANGTVLDYFKLSPAQISQFIVQYGQNAAQKEVLANRYKSIDGNRVTDVNDLLEPGPVVTPNIPPGMSKKRDASDGTFDPTGGFLITHNPPTCGGACGANGNCGPNCACEWDVCVSFSNIKEKKRDVIAQSLSPVGRSVAPPKGEPPFPTCASEGTRCNELIPCGRNCVCHEIHADYMNPVPRLFEPPQAPPCADDGKACTDNSVCDQNCLCYFDLQKGYGVCRSIHWKRDTLPAPEPASPDVGDFAPLKIQPLPCADEGKACTNDAVRGWNCLCYYDLQKKHGVYHSIHWKRDAWPEPVTPVARSVAPPKIEPKCKAVTCFGIPDCGELCKCLFWPGAPSGNCFRTVGKRDVVTVKKDTMAQCSALYCYADENCGAGCSCIFFGENPYGNCFRD